MQAIIGAMKSDMRLLVASINKVEQVTKLAACGVNCFALNEGIIRELLKDEDTDKDTNYIAKLFEGNPKLLDSGGEISEPQKKRQHSRL